MIPWPGMQPADRLGTRQPWRWRATLNHRPLRAARRAALATAVFLALGAGAHAQSTASGEDAPLRLAYVDWSSSVASHTVLKAVLEEHLGVTAVLRETTAQGIWADVAAGRADATLSAWLPRTHATYHERYGADVADLGPNLEGARTGIVVAAVRPGRQTGPRGQSTRDPVQVDTIGDLRQHGEAYNFRIVGIDPEAGVMRQTREALRAYDLEDFRLVSGSEAAMVEALERAIRTGRHVAVTGWQPHWMFAQWNLKFLEDPENVYGEDEAVHTLTRPGLQAEQAEVAAVLDAFRWSLEDMERLLIWNRRSDSYPYENALRWIRLHEQQVRDWLP